MADKISLSRWNIGEASKRSIGDYESPSYQSSCRILKNFVVSENGKAWRRPGLKFHTKCTIDGTPETEDVGDRVKLFPYYRRDESFVLLFYLLGTGETTVLHCQWYKTVSGRLTYQGDIQLPDGGEPSAPRPWFYQFKAEDLGSDRPKAVDIKRLSIVQVEKHTYVTHPNMEDPMTIFYGIPEGESVERFTLENYSTDSAAYIDVVSEVQPDPIVPESVFRWQKIDQTDLNAGGGVYVIQPGEPGNPGDEPLDVPMGWGPYTGEYPGQAQTFKYLACVTFAYERLIFAQGPHVFGTKTTDPLVIGHQYNGDNDQAEVDSRIDVPGILSSDPFAYTASSDLGYEDIYWLASGSLLMGGANNGAWVLSNPAVGGIDTTNPLMYKATSNGAYRIQGKTVGDALLYFQRPGRIMNEFIFSEASRNYMATNLSEFSDHLFYDHSPVEMEVQRAPFNVVWVIREDGVLVSFTYDRQRAIYAWARHNLDSEFVTSKATGKFISLTMSSDSIDDFPVFYMERENADGIYHSLEVMDEYTPDQITGTFVDAAVTGSKSGRITVTSIDEGTGHRIFHFTGTTPVDGMTVKFNEALRTNDPVAPVIENLYDFIHGVWTIDNVAGDTFTLEDNTGELYNGIYTLMEPENSYISYGYCEAVATQPDDPSLYEHLSGHMCEALLDSASYSVYISSTLLFYDPETFPVGWDGNEAELTDEMLLQVEWNHIIIGMPYESIFAPYIIKKQINKGKMTKMELEVFRTLGGQIGTANTGLDDKIESIKVIDITYPSLIEEDLLYTGTVKPQIVGGFGDDPFFFLFMNKALPFNLTNIMYYLEAR